MTNQVSAILVGKSHLAGLKFPKTGMANRNETDTPLTVKGRIARSIRESSPNWERRVLKAGQSIVTTAATERIEKPNDHHML
jgi:hypothetical protein